MTASLPVDRHSLILPTLCWGKQHADFYAVTEDISTQGISFRSAVVPEVGSVLTCSIRFVGTFEARVVAGSFNTFCVRLTASRGRIAEIIRTMMALAREQDHPSESGRRHRRITPRRRDVLVKLDDGHVLPGRLINVSVSGAALHLSRPVAVGTSLILGTTAGKVVRQIGDGVGVVFDAALDPARVDPGILL